MEIAVELFPPALYLADTVALAVPVMEPHWSEEKPTSSFPVRPDSETCALPGSTRDGVTFSTASMFVASTYLVSSAGNAVAAIA